MASKEIYTKADRWFTAQAVEQGYLSEESVREAIQEQVQTRHQQGHCPHIWEIVVILGHLEVSVVEEILGGLGAGTDSEVEGHSLNMLGRVLVELGYTDPEKLVAALELQANERRNGTWRLLGQILVEQKYVAQRHLTEALEILNIRRKQNQSSTEVPADAT